MTSMSAGEKDCRVRSAGRSAAACDGVLEDSARCGVVGEETNKLVSYPRQCRGVWKRCRAVVVQPSSAAGKSSLMDAALAFVPEEERIQHSALDRAIAVLHGRDGSETQGSSRSWKRKARAALRMR